MIFAKYGIPEQLRFECGPQFLSTLFVKSAERLGFRHTFSSAKFPQSNDEAERAMQTVKNLLKKSTDSLLAL